MACINALVTKINKGIDLIENGDLEKIKQKRIKE